MSTQKHPGLILDEWLKFTEHINSKISKCDKLIGIIKKLSISFPRNALLRIYKSFIKPHLDYADIMYDKPNNTSFKNKLENVQYRVCIAITGAIQGTFRERLYRGLGLESLTNRRWIRKLVIFYKIINGVSHQYLVHYLNLNNSSSYITRSSDLNKIKGVPSRTEQFKYAFFPLCINKWNRLDNMIKKSVIIKCHESMLMKCFSLYERSLFSIHDPTGVKLLARLQSKFSHLNEQRFRHNFKDNVAMWECGTDTTEHFLLYCHFFVTERQNLFNNAYDKHFFSSQNLSEESMIHIL